MKREETAAARATRLDAELAEARAELARAKAKYREAVRRAATAARKCWCGAEISGAKRRFCAPLCNQQFHRARKAERLPALVKGVEKMIAIAAKHCGVTAADVRGPRVHRTTVQARQVAMVLARRRTAASLKEIARVFNRHHTTVLYAIQRAEAGHVIGDIADEIEARLDGVPALVEFEEAKEAA